MIPEGDLIINDHKVTYIRTLKEQFNTIQPVLSESDYHISFVPMAKFPFNGRKEYIPGIYILRIVITPQIMDQIYYYQG